MHAAAADNRSSLTPAVAALAIVVVSALAVAGMAVADGEALPVLVLAAALTLPLVLLIGTQTLVWNDRYAFYAAILLLILQSMTFRVREIEDKSIDLQILIKLACVGSLVVLSFSSMVKSWPGLPRSEIWLWFMFFVYAVVNSLNSIQPAIAFIETFSNVFAFLYIYNFSRLLGPRNLANVLISACFVLCIMSIAAYVLDPHLGRMSDWVNGAFVPTSRLTGVLNTANAAGATAAIGIMLTVLWSQISPRRPLFYILVLPMLFCLLASNNRMSLAAMGAGFFYVYLMRGRIGLKLAVALLLLCVGTLFFVSFGDTILSGLSRSGSADEITSGTGRTRIWAVVIDLWLERPLFGYGPGSAKFILPVHPLLFKAAAHPHNMYLNVLFAGGIVGFSLFMTSLVVTLRRAWSKQAHATIAVLIFYLFNGITEPVIGGLVSFLSFSFYAIPCLMFSDQHSSENTGYRPEASPFRYASVAS